MFSNHVPLLVLACWALSISESQAQQPDTAPARIVLRLAELKPIEGVTESSGFAVGEGGSLAYYHKTPALILTPSDVDRLIVRRARLSVGSTGTDGFSVKVLLTTDARQRIAAKARHGDGTRYVAAFVDGHKSRVLHRYEVKKTVGVPEECQAKSFNPSLLFLHSEARVEDIVASLIQG